MELDSRLNRSVVYDFCLWYCVEGLGGHHEITDAFTEVSELNQDVLEEGISGLSPNDHDFSRYNLARKRSM